ncbi:CgeB family protein [Paenibacillus guangzhouensis]|uniref:CgeB family protein n=1 Tax=Paenibacillus guangzhouensis TaxID=1473112 RepID=UPI001267602E|nr:glycosyltransferase [Paenibacillus guangzhouensis]
MTFRFTTGVSVPKSLISRYSVGTKTRSKSKSKSKRKIRITISPKTETNHARDIVDEVRRQGRDTGFDRGFDEGYLRGRANVIMNTIQDPPRVRPIHVMYVASGKGFPYSPLDEAIISTLQGMVARVTPTDPRQPIASQAAELNPDLVLALDGMELPIEQIQAVRSLGIRTAIWLTDDPYYTDFTSKMVPHYDHVFTLELNCVPYYQALGNPNVHYLPFGFHLGQYRPLTTLAPVRRDISFIGSGYWNRIAFFDELTPYLQDKNVTISGLWWDRLRDYSSIKGKIELDKWMGPQETSDVYNGSKIVINMHRSYEDDSVNNNASRIQAISPNIRTFEISASGTLQLTDVRSDLARFYTPGVEIETYSSPQELKDKIDFYLTHEKERREIALRALSRTLREHSYNKRIDYMLSMIFES